jgi:hypothetical protein
MNEPIHSRKRRIQLLIRQNGSHTKFKTYFEELAGFLRVEIADPEISFRERNLDGRCLIKHILRSPGRNACDKVVARLVNDGMPIGGRNDGAEWAGD